AHLHSAEWRVMGKALQWFSRLCIPESDLIGRWWHTAELEGTGAAVHPLAVRAEGYAHVAAARSAQDMQGPVGVGVPEAHRAIQTSGRDRLAIGAECHVLDIVSGARELVRHATRTEVPDPDDFIAEVAPRQSAHGELAPIRAKRHGHDLIRGD